jgi:hypothetical protein
VPRQAGIVSSVHFSNARRKRDGLTPVSLAHLGAHLPCCDIGEILRIGGRVVVDTGEACVGDGASLDESGASHYRKWTGPRTKVARVSGPVNNLGPSRLLEGEAPRCDRAGPALQRAAVDVLRDGLNGRDGADEGEEAGREPHFEEDEIQRGG